MVHFITQMMSCSIYQGWQRGGPQSKGCISRVHSPFFELGAVHFSLSKCLKLQCLGQKPQEKASSSFFQLETPSPSVYLGRHWRHLHHKMDQAFPLRFLYTASDQKLDGAWEGLGTWLTMHSQYLELRSSYYIRYVQVSLQSQIKCKILTIAVHIHSSWQFWTLYFAYP